MSHARVASRGRAAKLRGKLPWTPLPLCALSMLPICSGPGSGGRPAYARLPQSDGLAPRRTASAFRAFSSDTPRGHRPVALRLDVDRRHGALGENLGFNAYRTTDGAWTRGVPIEGHPTQTVALASVSNARALSHSVQIFNYLPGVVVGFTLDRTLRADRGHVGISWCSDALCRDFARGGPSRRAGRRKRRGQLSLLSPGVSGGANRSTLPSCFLARPRKHPRS